MYSNRLLLECSNFLFSFNSLTYINFGLCCIWEQTRTDGAQKVGVICTPQNDEVI